MKVFISWSGTTSMKVAEELRDWLPTVIQQIKPYFTPHDIEKGKRWSSDIAGELQESQIGILCITRDNLKSEWLHFEAGALSKSIDDSNVCPILFGVKNSDLTGPLSQFQTTSFNKDEMYKLVGVINNVLAESRLEQRVLSKAFEMSWSDLDESITGVLSVSEKPNEDTPIPIRKDRELLEEVLERVRGLERVQKREKSISTERILGRIIPIEKGESIVERIITGLPHQIMDVLDNMIKLTPGKFTYTLHAIGKQGDVLVKLSSSRPEEYGGEEELYRILDKLEDIIAK